MIVDLEGREVAWQPLPKQQLAMECPAFELLYGGSKGGAKTNYLVACVLPLLMKAHEKWLATGIKQRKCRVMVFRKNLDDLKDFIIKSHEVYPAFDPEMGQGGYHTNNKEWTFSSGATVSCRHLDGPEDHLGYNGNEFTALLFDEIQQIPYSAYSFLLAQVRTSDPDYRPFLMVRATANPGGYDWVATHFKIDDYPDGGRILVVPVEIGDGDQRRTVEVTRAFIRSYLRDNPYLNDDGMYEGRLRASMNEDEIAQYLGGDFFRVAGSYFSKFLRPQVHFVKSSPIPSSWEMGYAIDWGSAEPASLHVGAVNPADGALHVIDELYGPGDTGRRFGERMAKFWKRQAWSPDRVWKVDDFYGVIDKQALDNVGGDGTAGAGIMSWGFRLFPAEKDRDSGCNQMKERLLMNRMGNPQVYVYEDRCPQIVRALSKIKSNAPEKPEEYQPRSEWSHACDSFRFLCMRFTLNEKREENPVDAEVARWNRIFAAQNKPAQNQTAGMTGGYDG